MYKRSKNIFYLKYVNQIIHTIGMNYCYRFIIFMQMKFYFKEDGESKLAAETKLKQNFERAKQKAHI